MRTGVKYLFLIAFAVASTCCTASIQFKHSIGGNSPDHGYCARQTYDNGYIAVGTTSSFTNGNSDIYVVRTDSNGIVAWTKNFGTANIEVARYVEELKDSSIIIVGYTNNTTANGYDVYLLRLDRWGNKVWEKTYGGTDWEFAYSVHQTSDGGFIIAGGTYSYGKGSEDMYLIKTNINGDTTWTKTFGGRYDDEARSVRETAAGEFILTGYTKSFTDTTGGDAYVVKTNSTGDTLWTKSYGGLKEDLANDIIECKNGDYVFCGRSYSYCNKNANMYLARLYNNGSLNWQISNGLLKDSIYDSLESLVELQNGNLASIGVTFSYGGGQNEGYLLITNASGGFINGPTYGTGGKDECYSVAVTRDKGFIICGFTDSTKIGFNAPNLFLIKTDSTGQLPKMKFWFSVNDMNNGLINTIDTYPNPFTVQTNITINSNEEIYPTDLNLELSDISGRICAVSYRIVNSRNKNIELQMDKGNLQSGIYFVRYFLKYQCVGASKVIVE